jgi:hypothetical protein
MTPLVPLIAHHLLSQSYFFNKSALSLSDFLMVDFTAEETPLRSRIGTQFRPTVEPITFSQLASSPPGYLYGVLCISMSQSMVKPQDNGGGS